MMRILVVKLSSIGDVVHTLPAVAALRRAHPDARISWVVDVRASAILKESPAIDELIEIDSRKWRSEAFDRRTFEETQLWFRQLRGSQNGREPGNPDDGGRGASARRPDIAIDFQGLVKSGLIALLSGGGRRVGLASHDLREKASRYLLTDQAPTARAVHVIDKNLELADSIPKTATEPLRNRDKSTNGSRKYEFPINIAIEDQRYV